MNTKWSSRISSEEECEQEHLCPRHQSKVRVVMSSDIQLCSEHSDEHQHQVTLIHVNSEQFGGISCMDILSVYPSVGVGRWGA